MAFVKEVVPEKDREFWLSMELKNCWGNAPHPLLKSRTWCADRERNAYLIGIGGGMHDLPLFYDLWWNGIITRVEALEASTGNATTGIHMVWNIIKVPIPEEIWEKRSDVMELIKDAFYVEINIKLKKFVKSITVNINCVPELKKGINK